MRPKWFARNDSRHFRGTSNYVVPETKLFFNMADMGTTSSGSAAVLWHLSAVQMMLEIEEDEEVQILFRRSISRLDSQKIILVYDA